MKKFISYIFPSVVKKDILKAFVTEMVAIEEKVCNINFGGCGIFAEHLYDKLKLLGFRPKIVVFVYSKVEFEKSMAMLAKRGMNYYINQRTEGFPHVVVKAGGYYIDSTGAYKDYRKMQHYRTMYTPYEGMDIDQLRECNQPQELWNNSFYRGDAKVIGKHLEKVYKKVDKLYLVIS